MITNTEHKREPEQQDLDTMTRFFQCAPKKPYCSDDLSTGVRIRARTTAFNYSHVQHNQPALRHWLTFDVDHENYFQWEQAGLPDPNLIVRNQDNRKCHIHYAINPVCTSDAARPKPLYYCESVSLAYTHALESDPRYSGLITKNPFHSDWHVHELHDHVYSLGELADYVELQTSYRTRKRAANSAVYGIGRNCTLFDRTRFWSYDHVMDYRQSHNYSQWLAAVLEKAETYNDFPEPLPHSEIRATARSVAKWVWTKYVPNDKRVRRGAMAESLAGSQIDLDLKTKQRLSARRTNETQRANTRESIIEAVGRLITAGKRVSVRALAAEAGMSTRTIQNHKDLIQS